MEAFSNTNGKLMMNEIDRAGGLNEFFISHYSFSIVIIIIKDGKELN